ncbi:MAG: hypothetical protein WCO89_02165 [Syntrophus sp. (in: bacteria)]
MAEKVSKNSVEKCAFRKNGQAITKIAATPQELRKAYGYLESTAANERCKKTGAPYFLVGRRVYYRIDEFEAWFFSRPVKTRESI